MDFLRSCASLKRSVGNDITKGTFGFPKKTVSLERWIAFESLLTGTAYYWRGMHGTFNGIPLKTCLETGDPRAIAIRDGIINVWRRIVPYLITHRSKEWWEVGSH
jgi:hypothetical protein